MVRSLDLPKWMENSAIRLPHGALGPPIAAIRVIGRAPDISHTAMASRRFRLTIETTILSLKRVSHGASPDRASRQSLFLNL